jgi:hypothetical protein
MSAEHPADVVAYAATVPYTLTIYRATTPVPAGRKMVGYYVIPGGVPVSIWGATAKVIRERAAAHHLDAMASTLRNIGGVEEAKRRRAEAVERRRKKAEAAA